MTEKNSRAPFGEADDAREPGAQVAPSRGRRDPLPYPLLRLARQGEVMSMRNGGFIPPLTAQEYAQARCLREAALGGTDFSSMLANIEEAGFRIRPTISARSADGTCRLIGLSFTRDGITISAGAARLRFSEQPDNPRAPCPERDIDLLLRLRAAYDREHAPQLEARRMLLADIRRIENSCLHIREAASMLLEAGITSSRQIDEITMGNAKSERRLLSLQRDGAEVRIRWASCPIVWRATRNLADAAEKEAAAVALAEPDEEPEAAGPQP